MSLKYGWQVKLLNCCYKGNLSVKRADKTANTSIFHKNLIQKSHL